jgi:hypothetical protein
MAARYPNPGCYCTRPKSKLLCKTHLRLSNINTEFKIEVCGKSHKGTSNNDGFLDAIGG